VALFLSTYENKVDRKGRVSVPAQFRAAVSQMSFNGIVLYPSINSRAIEGSGIDRLEELSDRIDALPEFSDERDALSGLFADAVQCPFDGEGRIILPPELCEHAGIVPEGNATFVGYGRTFQIWEPGRFAPYQQDRRARARGITLPSLKART
jgi:MraZ protein